MGIMNSLHTMPRAIPGDPTESRFLFITVAARRARQLEWDFQRKVAVGITIKPIVVAMEETGRGLVAYSFPEVRG